MSEGEQELAALAIVAAAFVALGRGFYRRYVAAGLSRWLLKRGRVKLAMRVREHDARAPRARPGGGGGDCCG